MFFFKKINALSLIFIEKEKCDFTEFKNKYSKVDFFTINKI